MYTLAPETSILQQLFISDAESAIEIFEAEINNKEIDMELYETTAHGIKSALMNVGETELSDFALKLEQAGINKDKTVIDKETPVFVASLKKLVEKFKPQGNAVESFLGKELLKVKAACEKQDKDSAKNILSELLDEEWTEEIEDVLDEINVFLLHNSLEKAAVAAENAAKRVG